MADDAVPGGELAGQRALARAQVVPRHLVGDGQVVHVQEEAAGAAHAEREAHAGHGVVAAAEGLTVERGGVGVAGGIDLVARPRAGGALQRERADAVRSSSRRGCGTCVAGSPHRR